ncbi:hypothetical protein B0T18DRAFT_401031 [Schizothecium vesticola]|uniref:Uncharacterized protein n=1 Tax=Schizothecium vesticola TaxID=314040 RepID=A0AA40K9X6_9PEZI|nr:hypothetical protein B0T18DRAFT_401031 [Schizothecium vesticola]
MRDRQISRERDQQRHSIVSPIYVFSMTHPFTPLATTYGRHRSAHIPGPPFGPGWYRRRPSGFLPTIDSRRQKTAETSTGPIHPCSWSPG